MRSVARRSVPTWPIWAMAITAASGAASSLGAQADSPPAIRSAKDGAEMVLVPAGPFIMGSDAGDSDERFAHRVELPAFYIDRLEVTCEQYARFLAATGRAAPVEWPGGRPKPGTEQMPVGSVTWHDASAYATWAGKRLLTEAEWEKAARGTDGRTYPWGNEWKPDLVNLEGDTSVSKPEFFVETVGRRAGNASPCGARDMIGNAWEWTSSWYQPYPGSPDLDVHYGEKFKVIRGGGAIYYYGVPPVRRCADRYRCLPYGRFEGIGFRCAMDAPGAGHVPASPLDSPPAKLPAVERQGRPEFQAAAPLRLRVRNTASLPRRNEVVTSGVPFSRGVITRADQLRVRDDAGRAVPLQAGVIGTWPGGSARWVLVEFPVDLEPGQERTYLLDWAGDGAPPVPVDAVTSTENDQRIVLSNGRLRVVVDRRDPAAYVELWRLNGTGSPSLLTGPALAPRIEIQDSVPRNPATTKEPSLYTPAARIKGLIEIKSDTNGYKTVIGPDWTTKPLQVAVRPPDQVQFEVNGPLRTVLRADGWITDQGDRRLVRYTRRLTLTCGSDLVRVATTFTNLADSKMLWVSKLDLVTQVPAEGYECRFGGSPVPHVVSLDASASSGAGAVLSQSAENGYVLSVNGREAGAGCRTPGWVDAGGVTLLMRDCWQQFPNRIAVAPSPVKAGNPPGLTVGFGLWGGTDLLDFDQGMSKTHEILIAARVPGASGQVTASLAAQPLFAVAPESWYCGTGALGELSPFDFNTAPAYESAVESGFSENAMRAVNGFRDFGDEFFPGGNKGEYAFVNMEYDVPYGFLTQFARTGLLKYLRAADTQVRHQVDIDINHKLGQFWKHSPRHMTYENPDFGHVFFRGLIEHYHFTGERRSLEAAVEIGDWVAARIPKKFISGRCVGWSLLSLSALYEATWDEKYRQALNTGLDALLAQRDPRGCFAADTGSITFFLGIQAGGCIRAAEATGHEGMKACVPLLLDRILGTPIEYNGRTLFDLAWGFDRTGDPRYLDCAERTLERVLEHNARLDSAHTYFTQHYLAFRKRCGLGVPDGPACPPLTAEQCRLESGLWRRFVPVGQATLFIEDREGRNFPLTVFGHSCRTPGSVRVLDDAGRTLATGSLPATGGSTGRLALAIPPAEFTPRVLRVELDCARIDAWDLLTPAPMRTVWSAMRTAGLDRYPARLYFRVLPGTRGLEFAVNAEREQFHGMAVFDPAGEAVGGLRRFIDLADQDRYRHRLVVPVREGQDGRLWSIELRDMELVSIRGGRARTRAAVTGDLFEELPGMGAEPWFAPSREAWFCPERPAE